MYTIKKYTAADLKAKNAVCPATIVGGYTYVVTRYSVDVSEGCTPEVFKELDIAAFGSEPDAEAYCISAFARDLEISSDIQYFYKVRCVEVD